MLNVGKLRSESMAEKCILCRKGYCSRVSFPSGTAYDSIVFHILVSSALLLFNFFTGVICFPS